MDMPYMLLDQENTALNLYFRLPVLPKESGKITALKHS